jgi:hypothetical protein
MNNANKWSYLAGVFDGEGSVGIGFHKLNSSTHLVVSLSSTNLELMKWCLKHFGGVYYVQSRGVHKTEFKWMPKGKKNREIFFLGILPYLIIKRKQVLLALEFDRLNSCNPELRMQMREQMFSLNKGSVETNTQDSSDEEKIESVLIGDNESAPVVTQVIA